MTELEVGVKRLISFYLLINSTRNGITREEIEEKLGLSKSTFHRYIKCWSSLGIYIDSKKRSEDKKLIYYIDKEENPPLTDLGFTSYKKTFKNDLISSILFENVQKRSNPYLIIYNTIQNTDHKELPVEGEEIKKIIERLL